MKNSKTECQRILREYPFLSYFDGKKTIAPRLENFDEIHFHPASKKLLELIPRDSGYSVLNFGTDEHEIAEVVVDGEVILLLHTSYWYKDERNPEYSDNPSIGNQVAELGISPNFILVQRLSRDYNDPNKVKRSLSVYEVKDTAIFDVAA